MSRMQKDVLIINKHQRLPGSFGYYFKTEAVLQGTASFRYFGRHYLEHVITAGPVVIGALQRNTTLIANFSAKAGFMPDCKFNSHILEKRALLVNDFSDPSDKLPGNFFLSFTIPPKLLQFLR